MEFLFAPKISELKQEITLYRSLELDQTVRASGHDSVDFVDLYVVEDAVNGSVLLKRTKQN